MNNLTHITHTHSTPHNAIFISFIHNGQPQEVKVQLQNEKGLGLNLWLCMVNNPHRSYTTTLQQITDQFHAGRIPASAVEKFITMAVKHKLINPTPKPQPAPNPSIGSSHLAPSLTFEEVLELREDEGYGSKVITCLSAVPFEEEIEAGLSREEMEWYYHRDHMIMMQQIHQEQA